MKSYAIIVYIYNVLKHLNLYLFYMKFLSEKKLNVLIFFFSFGLFLNAQIIHVVDSNSGESIENVAIFSIDKTKKCPLQTIMEKQVLMNLI